jgi:hypothetical protein
MTLDGLNEDFRDFLIAFADAGVALGGCRHDGG